jgi:hypothetical protein
MGLTMRRRLKNFLPIVLIALAVQVFAPIGACWAASIAASDPLSRAVICHGNAAAAGPGQSDRTGPHHAHDGCCSVCSVLHTGAPVETPQTAQTFAFDRQSERAVWHEFSIDPASSRAGSPAQARAPPIVS